MEVLKRVVKVLWYSENIVAIKINLKQGLIIMSKYLSVSPCCYLFWAIFIKPVSFLCDIYICIC